MVDKLPANKPSSLRTANWPRATTDCNQRVARDGAGGGVHTADGPPGARGCVSRAPAPSQRSPISSDQSGIEMYIDGCKWILRDSEFCARTHRRPPDLLVCSTTIPGTDRASWLTFTPLCTLRNMNVMVVGNISDGAVSRAIKIPWRNSPRNAAQNWYRRARVRDNRSSVTCTPTGQRPIYTAAASPKQ